MSLTIYSAFHKPPKEVNVISQNDVYFDGLTGLTGNEVEAKILSTIDKARYCSSRSFYSRASGTIALDKSQLSTGTKTLLNVLSSPDLCFNVCECGDNVLELIPLIVQGKIYWDIPFIAYTGNPECDIIYGGKYYDNFYDFLSTINEGRYDEDED
ncbi:MAG: DUF4869 domain-containing protein [Oscillospiraceae bacterium]|nr:DUF4869 domain-containing protein [Oscillospiraceae bacterium]